MSRFQSCWFPGSGLSFPQPSLSQIPVRLTAKREVASREDLTHSRQVSRHTTIPALLAALFLSSVACSDASVCTTGMSAMCTCTNGLAVCDSDGNYGACRCEGGVDDAGVPPDGGFPSDGGVERCGLPGELALGPGIPTNLGGAIATTTDLDGDGQVEIISFSSGSHREIHVGTWDGTGLAGPGRLLFAATDLVGDLLVAVEENGMPVFIGTRDPSDPSSHVAYRYGSTGYGLVNLRWFPEPSGIGWYRVTHGSNDFRGFTFAQLFGSRSFWARQGVGPSAPLYRFSVQDDHVRAELVDGSALFGADFEYFALVDEDINGDDVEDVLIVTPDAYHIGVSASEEGWRRTLSLSRGDCERTMSAPRFVLVEDLDRDGDLDLVIAVNCTSQPFGFVVALARGGDDYELVHHTVGGDPHAKRTAALGDLDGDCFPDLLFTDGRVARNDGTGRFSEPMLASEVAVQGVPTLADLDFDGDLDVIWGQYHAEDSPAPIVQLNMLR